MPANTKTSAVVADSHFGDPSHSEHHDSHNKPDAVTAKVVQFTETLFNGPVVVREESDPEFPSSYLVVSVVATGEVEHIVALNHDWHRRIGEVAGEFGCQYRLSLDIR